MFAKPAVFVLAAIVGILAQSAAAPAQVVYKPEGDGGTLVPRFHNDADRAAGREYASPYDRTPMRAPDRRIPTYEAPMTNLHPTHRPIDTGHLDTRAADEDFQRGVDLLGSALGRLARRHAQQRAASQYYGQQASCPPGHEPQWYGADLAGKPILVCR